MKLVCGAHEPPVHIAPLFPPQVTGTITTEQAAQEVTALAYMEYLRKQHGVAPPDGWQPSPIDRANAAALRDHFGRMNRSPSVVPRKNHTDRVSRKGLAKHVTEFRVASDNQGWTFDCPRCGDHVLSDDEFTVRVLAAVRRGDDGVDVS